MYSIEIATKPERFLKKLEHKDKEAILRKLNSIRNNPFPHLKKLKRTKFWRLRIKNYRAILDVIVSGKRIIVVSIGHRKNIYD